MELPSTVVSIGSYAFEDATALESIEIPYGTLSIGANAFQNCTSLEHVNIADTVTTLGASAFRGCTNLVSVNTSKNLIAIPSYTFADTAIEMLTFGDKLETISGNAFSGSEQLRSVTIGTDDSAISSMAVDTFANTPSLEFINIENTREGVGKEIYSLAPWGGLDDVTVRYQGEFVKFEYYIEQLFPVYGEIKYMIYIWAYNEKNYIKEVHLPDQSYEVYLEGSYEWFSEEDPFVYEINDYGLYQFTGVDNHGSISMWFNVFVEEMEIPLISAQNIEMTPYQIEIFNEAQVLKMADAKGWTYDGDDLEVQLYEGEYDKLYELEESGDEVVLSMYVYDDRYGTYAKKEILVTLIESQAPMIFAESVEVSHAELLALKYQSEFVDIEAYERMIEESGDTSTDPALEAIKDKIIDYTEAYAINHDGTRDLPVDISEEYLKEVYQELLSKGSYFITLSAFDDIEGLTDEVTVEITYSADMWTPVVTGNDIEIKLYEAENMTAATFLELSSARAWAGDGEELIASISDSDIDVIKSMNHIGEIQYVKLMTVDPRYLTTATCEVRVIIVDGYSPLISANNADLDYKYYEIMRILDEDINKLLEAGGDISDTGVQESLGLIRKYIINLTKATATSYDKKRTLDVEITDDELLEIYTSLVDNGSAEVVFTTYDEQEKKGAGTKAILSYEEEKWYPNIKATSNDLTNEQYKYLEGLETTEEVKAYVIELTQAEAWNYDNSVELDVEVDESTIVDIVSILESVGGIQVRFSTLDPDQGTSAETYARLTYTETVEDPEDEIPLTPLEPSTPVEPSDPDDEIPLTPLEPSTPVEPSDPDDEIPLTPLEPSIPVTPDEPELDPEPPLIYAEDAELDEKYFKIIQVAQNDMNKLLDSGSSINSAEVRECITIIYDIVISITKAYATNYDESVKLDVNITDEFIKTIYNDIVENGYSEITLTTYDSEVDLDASTTAILSYVGEIPELEEDPEDEIPLIPLEPSTPVVPEDPEEVPLIPLEPSIPVVPEGPEEVPLIPLEPSIPVVPEGPEEVPLTPLEPSTPVVPEGPEEVPLIPLEPSTPVVPEEPQMEEPLNPDVTFSPEEDDLEDGPLIEEPIDRVETGDNSLIFVYIWLLILSGISFVIAYKRRIHE